MLRSAVTSIIGRTLRHAAGAGVVTCGVLPMLLPLVLLFIVVPIAELFVIIQVGQAIGVWWTIAILIADSILGSMLMRSQGRAAWRRFDDATQAGRVPRARCSTACSSSSAARCC